ncbi:U3 small nucleolar RNA-associated protein 6-domain-containing protein [Lipomyces oligophaga]|uniref:U3 small nucleolar RNA-associated protein 6-domain-containing protein n=1 Tax=Lipomyces oligophaga TaxID=45792 RepID=UPI0034CF8CD8
MSEKIRYYLEQTLPELEALQKLRLFSREEINSITRRRTEFEHRIGNRGTVLLDYLKYVQFEMNLDLLRRKRIGRLTAVTASNDGDEAAQKVAASVASWSGNQRILYVFNRATTRFPGNIDLWTQYISYAQQIKARKVLNRICREMVRLHPGNPNVWVIVADHELIDNANRLAARQTLLRGMKFNPNSKLIAQAYEKLEEDVRQAVLASKSAETQSLEQSSTPTDISNSTTSGSSSSPSEDENE